VVGSPWSLLPWEVVALLDSVPEAPALEFVLGVLAREGHVVLGRRGQALLVPGAAVLAGFVLVLSLVRRGQIWLFLKVGRLLRVPLRRPLLPVLLLWSADPASSCSQVRPPAKLHKEGCSHIHQGSEEGEAGEGGQWPGLALTGAGASLVSLDQGNL